MTVKFNMHIRIGADEFMNMIARYLPFELQSIEEIVELPMPKAPPAVVALAHRFKARAKQRSRRNIGPDLTKGMNRAVIAALESGPRTAAELKAALVKGGFSPNSTASQMRKLVDYDIVRRIDRGVWELVVPASE